MDFRFNAMKAIGVLVIVIAAALVLVLVWFIDELSEMSQETCTCQTCGMVKFGIPPHFYAGLIGVCILLFIGITLLVKGESFSPKSAKGGWERNLSNLEKDEKNVYKMLMDSNGTLFQSEIVEKSKLSKVKVTRTLDKLESMNLLERRRRGLTNIIVLK